MNCDSLRFAKRVRHRVAAVASEALARDLNTRRRLAALVLRRVEQALHTCDDLACEAAGDDLVDALLSSTSPLRIASSTSYGRQRILIGLVGPQLRGRRLRQRRLGDDVSARPQASVGHVALRQRESAYTSVL